MTNYSSDYSSDIVESRKQMGGLKRLRDRVVKFVPDQLICVEVTFRSSPTLKWSQVIIYDGHEHFYFTTIDEAERWVDLRFKRC